MSEEKNPPRAQIFRYFRIESRNKNFLKITLRKKKLEGFKLSRSNRCKIKPVDKIVNMYLIGLMDKQTYFNIHIKS